MSDSTRSAVTGPAIPVRGNDIDTDRIIPARFLKCVVFEGLGEHAFEDDRRQERQQTGPHPFDDPRYAGARILFVNRNFGCGSSREHAPQAIMRWGQGIQAVVGESFAEIFFGNCAALGVPCVTVSGDAIAAAMQLAEESPTTVFTLDLAQRSLTAPGLPPAPVVMPDGARQQLIAGTWDTTGELLAGRDAIAAVAAKLPYFSDGAAKA